MDHFYLQFNSIIKKIKYERKKKNEYKFIMACLFTFHFHHLYELFFILVEKMNYFCLQFNSIIKKFNMDKT